MSFLYRSRSIQVLQKDAKQSNKSPAQTPLPPAIENVPQKYMRRSSARSAIGASHIIRRVSSIFLLKKKPQPDLKLANSAVHHDRTVSFTSFSTSSRDSIDSDDDIRRPSGLGRAVSIISNRSLPPSPFLPPSQSSPYPSHDYQRTRALSSPNLLQSFNKARVKPKFRQASMSLANGSLIQPESTPPPLPTLPPPPPVSSCLPKEVTVHILSYLPRGTVASCAQVSKPFAAAARYSLYNTLNFDSLSLLQMEQLVAVLASRHDLTEIVSTFICHKWPSFFISDCYCRGGPPAGYVFQQRDALLTATFTLALERMTNITSLTLPAFDASLLSHHTAFGLRRLTFMNYTISESDARALFSWLDGQTNIFSLRFINLEDVYTPIKNSDTVPYRNSICGGRPGTAPASPFLMPPQPSPYSANFQQLSPPSTPTAVSPFCSPNLLPSLVELHATPSILTLLANSPLSLPSSPSFPSSFDPSLPLPPLTPTPVIRPLTTVSLNITTTLYTGLRPTTLISPLRGISHLLLRFGTAVDRRTFEKVMGAVGGVLGGGEGTDGAGEGGWIGLRTLEVGFQDSSAKQSRRDEALYKALQISLPRYKSLQSLRLFISHESFQHQQFLKHHCNGLANGNSHADDEDNVDNNGGGGGSNDSDIKKPSGVEQIIINSWLNMCPSLEVVTLFSGAQWRKELDDRQESLLSV